MVAQPPRGTDGSKQWDGRSLSSEGEHTVAQSRLRSGMDGASSGFGRRVYRAVVGNDMKATAAVMRNGF
jgi:hypothetical protein